MRVRIKNSLWERRHVYANSYHITEFEEFEGEEIAVKWVKPSQLALTTGDAKFPFRVIERSRIVSIDNSSYEFAAPKAASVRTVVVKGSRGNEYVVTLGATPACTCPGFTFRRTCKHVDQLAAA